MIAIPGQFSAFLRVGLTNGGCDEEPDEAIILRAIPAGTSCTNFFRSTANRWCRSTPYSSALAKVGLKLQKTSVTIEKLVVDHIDKLPTDN
jgi:hypothetical protein